MKSETMYGGLIMHLNIISFNINETLSTNFWWRTYDPVLVLKSLRKCHPNDTRSWSKHLNSMLSGSSNYRQDKLNIGFSARLSAPQQEFILPCPPMHTSDFISLIQHSMPCILPIFPLNEPGKRCWSETSHDSLL